MKLNSLTAISPIDGRYRKKTETLDNYFSEFALIKYRVLVEIEYFIALCEIPLPHLKEVKKNDMAKLRDVYENFSLEDAQNVKAIEKTTNHDVKAVEYFIKDIFDKQGLEKYREFVHFGLTSQDATNTAIPCFLKEATQKQYLPLLKKVQEKLNALSTNWQDIPMLAKTHGQPASPTMLGKEINVFAERLDKQLELLKNIPFSAKFGGATGNFNAHHAAYPDIDWVAFANNFIEKKLGISRSQTTTQIEHYDNLGALCDNMKRINTICVDLCRDCWTYISFGYFKQKIIKGETGSSTMPHKVNPIDFENAEGNFGLANAVFEHLSAKLPVSRLQRDLTDSTVLRNLGVPVAYTTIAFESLLRGLDKITVNQPVIDRDLENNWMVISEAIQTILRREGYPEPYEALKTLTRTNKTLDKTAIHAFIDQLKINESVKAELKKLTPHNYTGVLS